MAFFADDAIYQNMPGLPASGRDAVRKTMERFLSGWRNTDWEVVSIAANGPVVFAKRVGRTTLAAEEY